ncbi:hypothetical protein sh1_0003 [Citrobacter phage SH1]|uniref:Uncharacterized protein n=1 Tax=Citrobacter phage SH1 TaxID=1805464 RepID=A0A172JFZ8_9CAUD|nr:hypothetical protein BI011_gp03 [Citrobacter phage SH1]AMR59438.1 hypothetical protein sh1_0003 [Citrobacter phage SH1]
MIDITGGLAMVIFIAVALFAVSGWCSESRKAARYHRKMVKLMEHLDAEGRGREAIELVRKA